MFIEIYKKISYNIEMSQTRPVEKGGLYGTRESFVER